MRLDYLVVTDQESLRRVSQKVHDAKLIGLDIETAIPGRGATLDPLLGKIRLIQLNVHGELFVIDLWRVGPVDVLLAAMRSTKAIYIVHNAKFEQKWFWHHYRFEIWPVFDTLRASGLLYNGRQVEPFTEKGKTALDLDSCVKRELGESPVNIGKGGSNWAGTLTRSQLDYAAEDVLRLLDLRAVLRKKLSQLGLLQVAGIEFGVVLPEAECELNGLPIDRDAWLAIADHHKKESRKLGEELLRDLPHPHGMLALPGMTGSWNLASNEQLLPSLQKIAPDVTDTSHDTLAMRVGDYPIFKKVLKHREHTTRLKMFGPDWLANLHPKTNRVHTSYYSLLAAGRYSSSKPNLQQIPRDSVYRKCFAAPPGKVFVIADYSGIEMRIVAEVSKDERLVRVFQNGDCAHYETASLIMKKPVSAIVKSERQMAKPVNFGFIYGMGAARLVVYAFGNYGVAMTEAQAKKFRKAYFTGYRGIASWHKLVNQERESGLKIVRTLANRLRFLDPDKHYNEYFNCLDSKTEALTQRGWIPGPELKTSDLILTKCASTGKLVWQKPTDVKVWTDYCGPLVEFKSKSFSAVSTPNHRWLVRDKHSRTDVCRLTSEISGWGDHRIHRTGVYEGLPECQWSDDFVQFVGWFVTDGSLFPLKSRGGRLRMTLTQSQKANPEKVEVIDCLVKRLGWGHSRHVAKETQQVTWVFQDFETDALSSEFPERTLTLQFLRQLTSQQLILLRETMMLGDGSTDANKKRVFTASDKKRAELFQILCVMTGSAASLKYRDTSDRVIKKYESMGNVPKSNEHYTVTIRRRGTVQVLNKHKRFFEANNETIWCPIVPNTYFVARREGQVFITGNTPIQGTGADALKISLRNMHDLIIRRGYAGRVKLIHHVHDEILLEVDNDPELILQVKKDLELAMTAGMSPFLKRVPIVVDAHEGPSWDEAK
jgi:DNA polymerase-1